MSYVVQIFLHPNVIVIFVFEPPDLRLSAQSRRIPQQTADLCGPFSKKLLIFLTVVGNLCGSL